MRKRLTNIFSRKIFLVLAAAVISLATFALTTSQAQASQLTARKVTLSDSTGAATPVSYTFVFTAISATTIKSVNIDICDSAAGTCTPAGTGVPTGFTSTGGAVGTVSNIGSGGSWTGTFTTNGRIRIANAANTGSPSAGVSIQITGLTNPTATNTTYYARMTTYSDSAWTTALDTGTVAASTSAQISLALSVAELLTFCTGTSITGTNCGTIAGSSVNLGNGSTTTAASGTSVFAVSTNATTGYSVTVNGATLTSGANTITALASQTASSVGTSQFGLNLKANTTPSVGTNVTGTGTATATANYGTADSFRFVTGDSVASVAVPSNANTFTVSYIANIAGTTPPGSYTANMTYIATANF